MRFYNQAHQFYCGVDLHARTMYLCVFNHGGQKLLNFWGAVFCNRPRPCRDVKTAVVDLETDRGSTPQRCLAQPWAAAAR